MPHALTVGNYKSRTYTPREDLLPFLCKGRTCATTNPRDKVFALLPILADAQAENLVVDYAKGTARVFVEVATWLLSTVGPSFLPRMSAGSKIISLPSWVPDWSVHFREPWMIGLGECSQAARTPFRLYQSTSNPTDLYLIGVWKTAGAHAAFLQSPAALELAKGIGNLVDLVGVRHVEVDAEEVVSRASSGGGVLGVRWQEVEGGSPAGV